MRQARAPKASRSQEEVTNTPPGQGHGMLAREAQRVLRPRAEQGTGPEGREVVRVHWRRHRLASQPAMKEGGQPGNAQGSGSFLKLARAANCSTVIVECLYNSEKINVLS